MIEAWLDRWRSRRVTRYRNTDTGQWISKAEYDALPENQRAKVRVSLRLKQQP